MVTSVLLLLCRRITVVPRFSLPRQPPGRRDDPQRLPQPPRPPPAWPRAPRRPRQLPQQQALEIADTGQVQPSSWSRLLHPLPPIAGGPAAFLPVAASAGLLAFLSDASGHKTLLLAHPITRILTALPITPTPRLSPTIDLVVGPTSIIAVVAGDDLVCPFAVKNISDVDTCGCCAMAAAAAAATEMPPEVHTQFAAAEGGHGFECAAHGDYIVLAPRGPVARAPTSALVFDSRRDEWWWALLCPYVVVAHHGSAGGTGGRRGGDDTTTLHNDRTCAIGGLCLSLAMPTPTVTIVFAISRQMGLMAHGTSELRGQQHHPAQLQPQPTNR
uniref:Uncharacterized protein n=1 Tax=Oryza nivara TaxID=4536 RepID=A0A0E0HS79_ORYNI